MDDLTPNIPDVVRNLYIKGDYFQNAREWFYQKYLMQYRMRSIFIIVSCFVCVVTFLSFYLVIAELLSPQVLSGVLHNHLDQKYPIKVNKVLNASSRHSDKIIAQILIEDFIKKIESFDAKKKAVELDLKNKIFNNGGLQVNMVKIFENRFKSVYIPAYIADYQRVIEIKQFEYLDPDESLYYKVKNYFTPSEIGNAARVKFEVKYISKADTVDFVEEYTANIKFFFRPIRKINGEFTKIKFFIEDYNLTKNSSVSNK